MDDCLFHIHIDAFLGIYRKKLLLCPKSVWNFFKKGLKYVKWMLFGHIEKNYPAMPKNSLRFGHLLIIFSYMPKPGLIPAERAEIWCELGTAEWFFSICPNFILYSHTGEKLTTKSVPDIQIFSGRTNRSQYWWSLFADMQFMLFYAFIPEQCFSSCNSPHHQQRWQNSCLFVLKKIRFLLKVLKIHHFLKGYFLYREMNTFSCARFAVVLQS